MADLIIQWTVLIFTLLISVFRIIEITHGHKDKGIRALTAISLFGCAALFGIALIFIIGDVQ